MSQRNGSQFDPISDSLLDDLTRWQQDKKRPNVLILRLISAVRQARAELECERLASSQFEREHTMDQVRRRALLVVHADGGVELFGPSDLRVVVAEPIRTDGSVEQERLVNELAWLKLPRPYRELWSDGYCRAVGFPSRQTPASVAAGMWEGEVLGAVKKEISNVL